MNPEERAIAKTALDGISPTEVAALLGRSYSHVSNKRRELVGNDDLDKVGRGIGTKYFSGRDDLKEDLTFEEVFHENEGVILGTLLEGLSLREIGAKEGVTGPAISQRRNTLEKNGVLSSEGKRRTKEYHPGIRLVERLNRKDKINHGRATSFHWNPDENRFWVSEERDAETFHELDMLDRLAYRMDQAIDSDWRRPQLKNLDPSKRWSEDVEEGVPEIETEEEEVEIDKFDISDSDIEEIVEVFDLEYSLDDQNSNSKKKGQHTEYREDYSESGDLKGEDSDLPKGETSFTHKQPPNEESKEKFEEIRERRNSHQENLEEINLENNELLEPNGTEVSSPEEEIFDILKVKRRRRVIRYLKDNEEVDLGEIATEIARFESDGTARPDSSERKSVYVGLYQCHLPKMDDWNIVNFDKDAGTAVKGEYFEEASQYLPNSFGEGDHEIPLESDGIKERAERYFSRILSNFRL